MYVFIPLKLYTLRSRYLKGRGEYLFRHSEGKLDNSALRWKLDIFSTAKNDNFMNHDNPLKSNISPWDSGMGNTGRGNSWVIQFANIFSSQLGWPRGGPSAPQTYDPHHHESTSAHNKDPTTRTVSNRFFMHRIEGLKEEILHHTQNILVLFFNCKFHK